RDMNLNNNCIYDIYEDNANTIWFATHDAGIFSQHKKTGKWNHYHTGSAEFRLSSNKVICFLDDHAGNIWIGTDGGSLNRINVSRRESQVYDARTGFHGNVVYGLLMDDHRTIWIATNNGLYHYRPKE